MRMYQVIMFFFLAGCLLSLKGFDEREPLLGKVEGGGVSYTFIKPLSLLQRRNVFPQEGNDYSNTDCTEKDYMLGIRYEALQQKS